MIAALYALTMAVLTLYGINLLHLAVTRVRHRKQHQAPFPSLPLNGAAWPTVTVQVPLYNEALVTRRVIDAVAQLEYPCHKLEIQILDDSSDESVAIAAQRVAHWQAQGIDITHVRRGSRDGYKAGALAHGLSASRGTLIALFDADFVPEADFLQRMVPMMHEPGVGMAQARWSHLNADTSLLTRLQACALDSHFAVEQAARHAGGYFMSFNGTAGIWRRRCIEDAGGWQSNTLTEDLDLSYRAQLQGWQFRFVGQVSAPAELPQSISAWRAQQFRWTKGTAETALRLLRPLWQSQQRIGIKLEGTLHLTAHVVFPLLTLATVLHAPLLMMEYAGVGPGIVYFSLVSVSLTGLLGFFVAQLLAQYTLHPDWGRRMWLFPMVMAGTMGMALSNTRAIWQALRKKVTPFERTPKHRDQPWWASRNGQTAWSPVMMGEAFLALYSIAGLAVLVLLGAWAAVPFQSIFALAFSYVTGWNVLQIRRTRPHHS